MDSRFAVPLGIPVLVPIWEIVILTWAYRRLAWALAAASPNRRFQSIFSRSTPTTALVSILEPKRDTWGHMLERCRGLCEVLVLESRIGGGS
jgi:hypothetical protein